MASDSENTLRMREPCSSLEGAGRAVHWPETGIWEVSTHRGESLNLFNRPRAVRVRMEF